MTTAPATARAFAPPPVALRARDVADLTITTGYPCISVLLPTAPAAWMTPADLDRLRTLVAEVDRQLRDQGVTNRGHLLRALSEQVDRWASQPTDRGLAIYVSQAVVRSFRLSHTVAPRALVEATFATRALVSTLYRMPPHVVLVLHPTGSVLYAASGAELRPVARLDREALDEPTGSYLRGVDRLLAAYRAEHPSPLVLAGAPLLLDQFCAQSRNLHRLAGRVAAGEHASARDLASACAEAIEGYLRTRRRDALETLDQTLRDRPGDVASGISECWRGVHSRAPGLLLVEENYICPDAPELRPGPGSEVRSKRQDALVRLHDLVDDLMEQVIVRGGQVALVGDGELTAHDRVALIHRRRRDGRPAPSRRPPDASLAPG